MQYKNVSAGDQFTARADQWNAFQDTVKKSRQNFTSIPNSKKQVGTNASSILVKNDSGSSMPRYAAAVPTDIIIDPLLDEAGFKNQPALKVTKVDEDSAGVWVVLQAPLDDQEYGWAVVTGATVCKINLADVGDSAVESEGDSYLPLSSTSGSAQILYVKGGVTTADATGEQWAIIKLGGGAGSDLPMPTQEFQVLQAVVGNKWAPTMMLSGD